MKLATFDHRGVRRIGAVAPENNTVTVFALASDHAAFRDMQALIEGGEEAMALARAIVAAPPAAAVLPLDEVRLCSPVPVPIQIRDFLVSEKLFRQARAANLKLRCKDLPDPEEAFRKGVEQGICTPPPVWYEQPIYYKANRFTVIGTETDVVWPDFAQLMDYELEMGIFIGKTGRDISKDSARSHIFGYTIFNDMTSRDAMNREVAAGLGPAKGKDFDTGNVIGPWIVTADEIGDPTQLKMSVRINGVFRSSGTLAEMHHSFEDMIVHVSRGETLHAGEFFGSGTIGDGSGQEHGIYLSPGDLIEFEVEKIGVLRNRLVKRSGS
jgi:2-keto-4-pentenoate hydratase/2-oxohepta-3-ene-1,7-dioic acid hydratase in catechol pathway